MTGRSPRPQGGGPPGEPDGGGPRGQVKARVRRQVRDELDRRAFTETDSNRSQLIARCLDYSLFSAHRMPPDWTLDQPEPDTHVADPVEYVDGEQHRRPAS